MRDSSLAAGGGAWVSIALVALFSFFAGCQTREDVASNLVTWPGLRADLNAGVVDIEGVVGINLGWVEQVACSPFTRVHESVVVALARPSHIHAALLLLGAEPGRPGRWRLDENDPEGKTYTVDPPEGTPVAISVIYTDESGREREVPIHTWIRDYHTRRLLPDRPWTFGGSFFYRDDEGNERYAADVSGSVVGLVTFGDELLGWPDVLPDQEGVMSPEWEANPETVPPMETPLILRLRPIIENRVKEGEITPSEGD